MSIPSVFLRTMGIVLIGVGFFGIFCGLYAIKIVQDNFYSTLRTAELSISDFAQAVEEKRETMKASVRESATELANASSHFSSAGDKMLRASLSINSAYENLTNATQAIRSVSALTKDASLYLKKASQDLESWVEAYEAQEPFPAKHIFVNASKNIKLASKKFEESGEELYSISENLNATAFSLMQISSELEHFSHDILNSGKSLNKTGEALLKTNQEILREISGLLKHASNTISKESSKAQMIVNAFLVYFVLLHLLILGIGIALIVIEMNLFIRR